MSRFSTCKPKWPQFAATSTPLYVVRAADRDELQRRLAAPGIATYLHYPIPVHQQPAVPQFAGQRYPISEWIAGQCLSLPMYPEMIEEQIDAVVVALTLAAGRHARARWRSCRRPPRSLSECRRNHLQKH